jgi:hypothetical protein
MTAHMPPLAIEPHPGVARQRHSRPAEAAKGRAARGRDDEDSGWRFFAGAESDDDLGDTDNMGIFDVNTIADCDPDIIPLLDAPAGAAFARDPLTGRLTEADPPEGEG